MVPYKRICYQDKEGCRVSRQPLKRREFILQLGNLSYNMEIIQRLTFDGQSIVAKCEIKQGTCFLAFE